MRLLILRVIPAIVLLVAITIAVPCFAQDSDFNLSMHANSHATAKDIGLPVYPGSSPFKDKDSDSSADLGLTLNSVLFNLQVAHFVTKDSQHQVISFYRKALAKYGEVVECNHGKPVGSLTMTKSGLTCGDHNDGQMTPKGSDGDYELRAGSPERFRIVAVDGTDPEKTKFGLVALVVPKEEHGK
jgi:hypothetical protein